MPLLKMKPACKDYIWGGDRLKTQFHKECSSEHLAETWELSCHPDGPSQIVNGEDANQTLAEYINVHGSRVLGTNCEKFTQFPILIKLIDAKDNLSIQVHPSNTYALEHEGQYGKTEMWYIVDCKPNAFIYYGFAKKVSLQEFEERIKCNRLIEVLNAVPVEKGDVFFIEAGTIHAIGKDIVVAEIQQNSNITYRVYDYDRVDKSGNHRPLHIEKALEVTNREPMHRIHSTCPHIAKCTYFTVDKILLDGKHMNCLSGRVNEESFESLLFLEGEGTIKCRSEEIMFQKGDSFFIPASSGEVQIEGRCEALLTAIDS